MQVSVEDVSSVKKILHIEIPEQDVTREIETAYSDMKQNAKIKGFRPGKVPRSVLERMFKKDVNADVSSKLIQESLTNAIIEKGLKVIGSPQISPPELESQKPYSYSATVEVSPDLEEIDFKGLPLKKAVYQVKDEELELQLKMLQRNLAKQEPVTEQRPIADGDLAMIDYEGFQDGKVLPEVQKTDNYIMKLGVGAITQTLDEQVIGMTPGECKDITITFPQEYKNPALSGKTVDFKVTLKEIRKEILPEIDDDFAKQFGKYQTLEELKADILKDLNHRYEKRADQDIQEQIFQTLIERQSFEVPEIMINYELDGILAEIEGTFQYHNTSAEQLGLTREHLTEKYHDLAVKQVKRHLILSKIIEQEKFELSDEEMQVAYQDMAQTFGQPVDHIRDYYRENKDKLEYLKHTLLEKRAIRLIIEHGKIEEVTPNATEEKQE
ncbi:MAG: trigger factor [Desulfobacteraceae bacterium IS3]|nr:MAG: trigger factor [Desulfobacteraceae bacterium IS3]